MNTFGNNLRVSTFGESHGPAMGGIIDGFPAGFKIDFDRLREILAQRRPGSSLLVTQRNEPDMPEFLSGLTPEGVTTGTSIGFIIRNEDNRSKDYSELADKFRPNHADYTYQAKYGIRDYRGGGRASARETVNWVVAGGIAMQWLQEKNIEVKAQLTAVASVSFTSVFTESMAKDNAYIEVPEDVKGHFQKEIENAKKDGDSVGGIVSCYISGLDAGIGSPIFNKLHARLAQAMLTINAAKGFEYGLGFESASRRGSQILDIFKTDQNKIKTQTNFSGGIQGGISNGMPIYFNVAFKPTPTILQELPTVNTSYEEVSLKMKGRHDPCVAVRAVPVVKAMAALVIADFLI